MLQVQKTSYNEPTTVVLTSRAFLNQPHRLIVPNFGLKMDGTGNIIRDSDIYRVHIVIRIINVHNDKILYALRYIIIIVVLHTQNGNARNMREIKKH